MAFCQIVFSILVLNVVSNIATSVNPVIMWGKSITTHPKAYPLKTIAPEEFKDTIKAATEVNQLILVFLEENLSVEDFSLKTVDRETPFNYLQSQLDDSLYLPSVENSLKTLETLEESKKINHIVLTDDGLSAPIMPESTDVLFINLKDAREGESRVDMFQRHDAFMKDTVDDLQNQNVLAIYTGRNPSWVIPEAHSRVRRQAAANQPLSLSFDYLLIDVTSVTLRTDSPAVNLSDLISNSTVHNSTELSVTMNFENNSIALNFISSYGYWHFENVVLTQTAPESFTEELQPTSEVYALNGFAYRCAQQVVFASINNPRKANVTFSDLKIQPFFDTNGTASLLQYGDSFNCVGFFSVPIWSGLFVVFILLSITFYGIMMMMDIRTMDRFDDPKGKTITINAGE